MNVKKQAVITIKPDNVKEMIFKANGLLCFTARKKQHKKQINMLAITDIFPHSIIYKTAFISESGADKESNISVVLLLKSLPKTTLEITEDTDRSAVRIAKTG